MIQGRVLYVDGNHVWRACGRDLHYSRDGGRKWSHRASLPASLGFRMKSGFRLTRRLFRSGFHHFVRTGDDEALIIANREIFRMDKAHDELTPVAELRGSRPLAVCRQAGRVYYGEYRSNAERTPVHVWAGDLGGSRWEPVWEFKRVRHVHGVFCDPYSSAIWITTGDKDDESAIWVTTDGFRTLDKVIGGIQQYRVVQLLFGKNHLYFGSDAPDQINFIYRMQRNSMAVDRMQQVGSSVFFGCTVGDRLYFSTAVEPSAVNRSRNAEIWASVDGENWTLAAGLRKDWWPPRYFQYGQVFFPAGPGDGKTLWYSPFATALDQVTMQL